MKLGFALVLAALPLVSAAPQAADEPIRPDAWAIKLGMLVADIPNAFAEFACGTRGGPPGLAIAGFGEFAKCPREGDGLAEVYFRYDDELEYWARANGLPDAERFAGTKVYNFPVVLSAMIDASARVRGLRVVSDPRDRSANRERAYQLSNFLLGRFGQENWTCADQPALEGETPVFGAFVKRRCEQTAATMRLSLDKIGRAHV